MAELKTKENDASVDEFIDAVSDETKRADARAVCALMAEATGEPARMWGASIVGFGHYHYRYASGREGDWFLVGFSPRARNLTLYVMPGFANYGELLERLGKHKTGKSCLYVNKLADVDEAALRELVFESVAFMREKYPSEPSGDAP